MRILVVDDDEEIVGLLCIYLKNENYEILEAHNGREALEQIDLHPDIDVVLLDLMMPEVDGHEVLNTLRAAGNDVPVIILSAKSSDVDRITGLMSGADDYVVKPFNPLEVIARIKSIARRQARVNQPEVVEENKDVIEVGPLIINRPSHEVKTIAGKNINLTALEFDILYLLAAHQGTVYSADQILEEVWGQDARISSKNVMVHVSHLRDKIEEATDGEKVIQTVWGVGYKIEE